MIINYKNGEKLRKKTRRQNGFPKANISNRVQKIIIPIIIRENFYFDDVFFNYTNVTIKNPINYDCKTCKSLSKRIAI